MSLLAIDPGTTDSGFVILDEANKIIRSGVVGNHEALNLVRTFGPQDEIAIEMIASYGMAVGATTFETCVWIGRFVQAADPLPVKLIYRRDVKLHLCGQPRAKDPNIRQALLDMFGPPGTKKDPGPTHGVKSHAWSALAIAATARGLNPNGVSE